MAKMANFVNVSLWGRKKAVFPCVLGPTFSNIAKNEKMMKSVTFWEKRRFLAKMTDLGNCRFRRRRKAVFPNVFGSFFSEIAKNEKANQKSLFFGPRNLLREPLAGGGREEGEAILGKNGHFCKSFTSGSTNSRFSQCFRANIFEHR